VGTDVIGWMGRGMRQISSPLKTTTLQHLSFLAGKVWYVNGVTGDDTNYSGADPTTPFATITKAITESDAGDTIRVAPGIYDEAVDLNKNYLHLECQLGVLLINTTPGTVLTLSGDYCKATSVVITQAGQQHFVLTGTNCQVWNGLSLGATTAFDIDATALLVECVSIGHTSIAFDLNGASIILDDTSAMGSGGSTRGYYLRANCDNCELRQATSTGNGTAGFEIVSGASYNVFLGGGTGGGDGKLVDNGLRTQFANFSDELESERHEHIYPFSDGEGTAGDPMTVSTDAADETHGAATTKDYWGEPKILIPVSVLTTNWKWVGMNIYGTTANKVIGSEVYKVCPSAMTTQNGGNTWDEGETVLTVTDASYFEVDDLVWIVSDYVQATGEGEIVRVTDVTGNVVTIERETSQFGAPNTGLRWDHTTNTKMYLCKRPSDNLWHGFEFQYSCANAKESDIVIWHAAKQMPINCGLVIRSLNVTDNTNDTQFECTAIYED